MTTANAPTGDSLYTREFFQMFIAAGLFMTGDQADTDQWKNLGYWKDLSQLLASYSRQVLRTEIGKDQPQELIS